MNTNSDKHHLSKITTALVTNTGATKSKPVKKHTSEDRGDLLVRTKVLSTILRQKLWIKNINGDDYIVNASNSRWPLREHPDGSPAITAVHSWSVSRSRLSGSAKHDQFITPIISILIVEITKHMHSQKSLDKAFDACQKITPCENGWVDAHAVYSFLDDTIPFASWRSEILESLVTYGPPEEPTAPPLSISCGENLPFYFNSSVAFRVILSSPTLRGSLLREDHLAMDSLWYTTLTDPLWQRETMPMPAQFFSTQRTSTQNETSI